LGAATRAMGIFPRSESFSLCAGDGHARYVCSRLALYAQSIAPNTEHQVRNHHDKRYPPTGNYMLLTWTGRATSINVYLAWDPTSEPQRKKRARSGFDLCKYLAGKSCFFFQRAPPPPRRFFPEARSRRTTAMDAFIWRSQSPPPRSMLGEVACNRTPYQSRARWSGRAAARAFISAIPTVTLWSLPRLDCGRSTDEERELLLRCLGGQELPGIT
jgi:hypothetical protein